MDDSNRAGASDVIEERQPRRVTADDVALAAGVSQSAVSRTFTPGASASRRTRERVLKAAQELGYRPNFIARSLRARRTNMVGVMIADYENPWYTIALRHLTASLQKQGLHALLFNVGAANALDDIVPMVLQFQVDGLLLGAAEFSPVLAKICEDSGTPVVSFGRYGTAELNISSVCCDDPRAARDVADLLHARGYRRFAYVAGETSPATWNRRQEGFVERAAELGIKRVSVVSAGETSYAAGVAAAGTLLGRKRRPDAIFCQNDVLAMGVLDAARGVPGLRVPEDLGIVGFDDVPTAGQKAYGLTTVRQPFEAIMEKTIELIIARIAGSEGAPSIHLLPGEIILRGTVRP